MTKSDTIAKAQIAADRSGHIHLVLNLNPFSTLWVIRAFDAKLAREPGVIIVTPGGY